MYENIPKYIYNSTWIFCSDFLFKNNIHLVQNLTKMLFGTFKKDNNFF